MKEVKTLADVKWIKITTDMFDNRKIKHLRRLPDGDSIVLIWVMLLTMAGRCNAGGMIFLTENIPYTPKMLADELDFEENTVQLALKALEQFGMVVSDGNALLIANWQEYQNIEGMEKIREQNRLRKAAQRERQKALPESRDCHVTVTECHATDIEEDKDKEGEREKESITVSKDTVRPADVQQVVEKWNSLGLSQIRTIKGGTKRYDMLKRRIKDYGMAAILEALDNVQKSAYLKGGGKNGWVITFDWFILPNNFVKVLDGNYNDKREGNTDGKHRGSAEERAILTGVGEWF